MTGYVGPWRLWEGTAGDPAIKNAWAPPTSANTTLLQAGAAGAVIVNIAGLTAYTLSVNNGSADEARPLIQYYQGALTGDCTVTMPNVQKPGWAVNTTTGGHNVILKAGSGATVTIPPDEKYYFFLSNGGGDVVLPPVGLGGAAIIGTATNDNALAGYVGEFVTGNASAVPITTTTLTNVVTLSLSAGDWDVWGIAAFNPAGGANLTAMIAGIGTTSATLAGTSDGGATSILTQFTSFNQSIPAPQRRVSLATTSSVYLVTQANFTGGSLTCDGAIFARRAR